MEVVEEFWGGDGDGMKTEKIMKKMTTIKHQKISLAYWQWEL